MAPDDAARAEEQIDSLDGEIGSLLDTVEEANDHRWGVRVAARAGDMLRRHMTRAADLRREHLDAAAVAEEMDLAGLAELAGGVTRQRASQLRIEARRRRADSTGESA